MPKYWRVVNVDRDTGQPVVNPTYYYPDADFQLLTKDAYRQTAKVLVDTPNFYVREIPGPTTLQIFWSTELEW